MFFTQCNNKGSMYKLAVKVIDDVNTDISKIQDNLSDIRSDNLKKLSDRIKT